jgi:hypothetical protein
MLRRGMLGEPSQQWERELAAGETGDLVPTVSPPHCVSSVKAGRVAYIVRWEAQGSMVRGAFLFALQSRGYQPLKICYLLILTVQ